MIKKILIIAILALTINSFAQRGQKIGYVDLEYILEQIPEYGDAQKKLDLKIKEWQKNLNKLKKEIDQMKIDLNNEKALLTEDLIEERLEDIEILEQEYKKTEDGYFAVDGDLFFYRKMLVKPLQDQVFNAVQEIGKARSYEIIFDKSSDIMMLYTNEKADLSDLVLRSIGRTSKNEERKKQAEARKAATTPSSASAGGGNLTPEQQKAIEDREAARQASLDKQEKARQDRLKKREEQQAEIERKRQERAAEREAVRQQLETNKTNAADEKAAKEAEAIENE